MAVCHSVIFIQEITVRTKLIWYQKDNDQIDAIEMLWIKLKYGVKDRNQIRSLPTQKEETQPRPDLPALDPARVCRFQVNESLGQFYQVE